MTIKSITVQFFVCVIEHSSKNMKREKKTQNHNHFLFAAVLCTGTKDIAM